MHTERPYHHMHHRRCRLCLRRAVQHDGERACAKSSERSHCAREGQCVLVRVQQRHAEHCVQRRPRCAAHRRWQRAQCVDCCCCSRSRCRICFIEMNQTDMYIRLCMTFRARAVFLWSILSLLVSNTFITAARLHQQQCTPPPAQCMAMWRRLQLRANVANASRHTSAQPHYTHPL
jgi:hypothetical protein